MSQASVTAQRQPQSPTQLHIPSPFPPRRPFRHQLHAPFALQIPQQQRFRELRTTPTSATFAAVPTAPISSPSTITPPLVTGSSNLFDGVWGAMLERIHDELAHVHTLYAGALRKEQQEKEVFRAHCIRLKGERDLAREKLRRALGRKDYDDETQFPPPPDASNTSTTDSTASSPDIRNSTPPLSASSDISSFPSSSAVTLDTEQDFCTGRGSTASSPGHQQPEPIDSGSYPSPSPSCSSPPQSPILSRTARQLSQSGSPEPEEISAMDGTKDLISAVFGGIDGARERKRVCLDENAGVRAGKRRRTQESDGPGDSATATRMSPSCLDCAEDPSFDVGNHRSSRCSDFQSNGEAGKDTIDPIDDSSSPTPVSIDAAHRRNISFDLMYMLADNKVQCRICWYVFSFFLIISSHPHVVGRYKHTRGVIPTPKSFLRSATWDELANHCEQEHPAACEGVAGMAPREVMELRQRMVEAAALADAGDR